MKRSVDRRSGEVRQMRRRWPWRLAAVLVALGMAQACEPGYGTGPAYVWVRVPVWVAGRALDPDGVPVAGARVELGSDNLYLAEETGSGGAFAFRGIAKAGCQGFPCPLPVRVSVLDAARGLGAASDTLTIASPEDSVRLRTLRLDVVVRLP